MFEAYRLTSMWIGFLNDLIFPFLAPSFKEDPAALRAYSAEGR